MDDGLAFYNSSRFTTGVKKTGGSSVADAFRPSNPEHRQAYQFLLREVRSEVRLIGDLAYQKFRAATA